MTKRELVLINFDDALTDFLYYDRKEDSRLERGDIEEAVAADPTLVDELVARLRAALSLRP